MKLLFLILGYVITSISDQQPSTAIANLLPAGQLVSTQIRMGQIILKPLQH